MSTKRMVLAILAVSTVVLALVLGSQLAGAQPPAQQPILSGSTIPYPGRLTSAAGQPTPDGAYDFTFTLYDAATGGNPLWSEVQKGVPVQGSAFQVALGSVQTIPVAALNGGERWLGVAVRGPGESEFTALAPRQQVSVAPTAPDSPSAGLACPHDHLGERWIGDSGAAIDGLYVQNTKAGGTGVCGKSDTGDGVVGESGDPNKSGVYGNNTGSGYGVYGSCAGLVCYGMFSDGDMAVAGSLWVDSALTVQGYATFGGGKSGYVVEIAQNDDSVALEAGDVVIISGAGPAVVGEIPVVKVRRAAVGETSAVVGIADKHYVPASKAAASAGRAEGVFNDAVIAPGEYLTVVTLGAYKAIKVDASYGAIAPGDLLVASPNPGYAMRAVLPQPGTIIGKALSALPSGTGVIPVIVTLQ
ncbi:MAG: hypothetical protein KKA73_02025 [Chloroflexi bacterium]|nr:hypothetical protein [Chloroflexota bacterium]MBU1746444.1 hypothetical protein [Chloroflexota bacterium]